MMDPCYLLRNLKKKLKVNKWTDNLLIKLNTTIPYLDKLPKKIQETVVINMEIV